MSRSEPPMIPPRLPRYETPPAPRSGRWLHPASGLLILGVDWLFFAQEILTLETTLPLACFLAFTITTTGVFLIQRRKGGDSSAAAGMKALFGGVIAGLPTGIGGTVLGGWVLMLSGLSNWRARGREGRDSLPQ